MRLVKGVMGKMAVHGPAKDTIPDSRMAVITAVTQGTLILAGFVLLLWLRRINVFRLLVPVTPFSKTLFTGVLAGLIGATVILLAYFGIRPFRVALDNTVLRVFRRMSLFSVLLVSLVSALGEEIFFRGVLQTLFGVVVASLFFGFMHFGGRKEMWAFGLAALFLGFVFGYAYLRSGELLSALIAHGLYNLLIGIGIFLGYLGSAIPRCDH